MNHEDLPVNICDNLKNSFKTFIYLLYLIAMCFYNQIYFLTYLIFLRDFSKVFIYPTYVHKFFLVFVVL